jgi:lipooligosaccharide transport system permease protein
MTAKALQPKAVIRTDLIAWDRQLYAILSVWRRNFRAFKKSWKASIFWILIEPVFILLALGYGVGTFISNIEGLSYIEFFLPGLICNTAMLVSFIVSTYDNFGKLHTQKLYATQILTQLEPRDLLIGEVLWSATKGSIGALGVLAVAAFIGIVEPSSIPLAMLVVFVSSLFFAALGMLVTSMIKNSEQIIFSTSGLIIPMSLFCGTYFPLSHYPTWVKYAMYAFPLTHSVSATRAILIQGWSWPLLANIGFILVLFIVTMRAAIPRFYKKLIQ